MSDSIPREFRRYVAKRPRKPASDLDVKPPWRPMGERGRKPAPIPVSVEDALALVEGKTPVRALPDLFEPAFAMWVFDHAVLPGSYPGGTSSDLLAHFVWWCHSKGEEAPNVSAMYFGKALKRLGLVQGRRSKRDRGRRLYLMARAPAEYFCKWILQARPNGEGEWRWSNEPPLRTPARNATTNAGPSSPTGGSDGPSSGDGLKNRQ